MRLLAVPTWSFGRDRALLWALHDALENCGLSIHYLGSEVDHNRTVSAFSGEQDAVREGLLSLCELAFPAIDLNRHAGTYPRTGALDVCSFVPLEWSHGGFDFAGLQPFVEAVGAEIADRWDLPVYLCEKSDRGRNEAVLPEIREGGFGGLWGRELSPDFGPKSAHSRLGVAVVGAREFFVTLHVDFKPELLPVAKEIAEGIQKLREDGDPRFLGVRALAAPIPTLEAVQVCLTANLPDLTPLDSIVEHVVAQGLKSDMVMTHIELVGAIRPRDLEASTFFPHKPEQVVEVLVH